MIVKVTQEHIDEGTRLCRIERIKLITSISENCPTSLALIDTFKVSYACSTWFTLQVGMFPDNIVFKVRTPKIVRQFIDRFDTNLTVEPFEFELSLEGVTL